MEATPQAAADNDPALLYHYTDSKGLLGIFETGKLWATEARYLNDATELEYGLGLAEEVLAALIADEPPANSQAMVVIEQLRLLLQIGRENWRDDYLCFVACFCRCKDRLSQWRSYGKGFGGYSIGFKPAEIEATDLRFERVSYDETARKDELRALMREAIVDGTDMLNAQTSEAELWPWLNHGRFGEVAFYAPLYKSPGFDEENEWRIVQRHTRDHPALKVRPTDTLGLAPYIELDVCGERIPRRPLIGEVVVGPTLHRDLAERSLRLLLHRFGYEDDEVRVTRSQVPLRS